MFQLDLIKAKAIAKKYTSGSLASALKADPCWEYPLLDKTGSVVLSAIVAKENGKWTVVDVGQYLSRELIQFSSNENAILDSLSAQGIADINSNVHVRIAPFHLDLIYAMTKQGDFVMPLSDVNDLGLKAQKAYPAQEAILKIAEKVNPPRTDSTEIIPAGGSMLTNNQASTHSESSLSLLSQLSIAVVVAVLLGTFSFVMRRKMGSRVS